MSTTRVPSRLFGLALLAFVLGGCGKTLVFGERSGVNIALRFDTERPPPVEVNIGLERRVGTIVPPTRYSRSNEASGDAVSMFSGFQLESFDNPIEFKSVSEGDSPLSKVDVLIGTQFASGAAAVEIAKGDPGVVAEIVSVGIPPSTRPRSAAANKIADEISAGIFALGNAGRRCFATRLKLPVPPGSDDAANRQINETLRNELTRRRSAESLSDMKSVMQTVKGAC